MSIFISNIFLIVNSPFTLVTTIDSFWYSNKLKMSICLDKKGHIWPFFMFSIPLFLFFFRTFCYCFSYFAFNLYINDDRRAIFNVAQSKQSDDKWVIFTLTALALLNFFFLLTFFFLLFGSFCIMLISYSSIASLHDENKDFFLFVQLQFWIYF